MKRKQTSYEIGKSRAGKKMKPTASRVYQGRGELKFFDTSVGTAIATTGTVIMPSLNLLSAGTGESQLIGRKCTLNSVYVRMQLNRPAVTNASLNSVNSDDFVRIVLVQDRQANGTAPTIAQMFDHTDPQAMNNLENSQRFRVLKEWHVNLSDVVNHDGANYFCGPLSKIVDPFYTKIDMPLEFGTTPSGVITDVKSNNLALLGFSRTGLPVVSVRARIRYSDH